MIIPFGVQTIFITSTRIFLGNNSTKKMKIVLMFDLNIIGPTIDNPEIVPGLVNTPHPDSSPVRLNDAPVLLTPAHGHIRGKSFRLVTGFRNVRLPLCAIPG